MTDKTLDVLQVLWICWLAPERLVAKTNLSVYDKQDWSLSHLLVSVRVAVVLEYEPNNTDKCERYGNGNHPRAHSQSGKGQSD